MNNIFEGCFEGWGGAETAPDDAIELSLNLGDEVTGDRTFAGACHAGDGEEAAVLL